MISCLSDKHLERLAKIGYVITLFEEYFKKYRKQVSFIDGIDMKIFEPRKLTQETYDEFNSLLGAGWENITLATTMSEFLIYRNRDKNDVNTIVQKVSSIIYVDMGTVMRIADKSPMKMRFCVKYILRHEFGHIKDHEKFVGIPISVVEKELERRRLQYVNYRSTHLTDNSITSIEQWKEINDLDIERGANRYAHITERELIRVFNIMAY